MAESERILRGKGREPEERQAWRLMFSHRKRKIEKLKAKKGRFDGE